MGIPVCDIDNLAERQGRVGAVFPGNDGALSFRNHKETDQNQGAGRKPEPAEILKKIFGGDYADTLKDLEKKMSRETGGVIFVGPKIPELPKDILNEAKARGISIVHVSCQEFCMEIPRSRPPFLNGGRFA